MSNPDLPVSSCPVIEAEERIVTLRKRFPEEMILAVFDGGRYAGLLYKCETFTTRRIVALDCMSSPPPVQLGDSCEAVGELMRSCGHPALPVFSGSDFCGVVYADTVRQRPPSLPGTNTGDVREKSYPELAGFLTHEVNNLTSCATAEIQLLGDIWKSIEPILNRYQQECGDFLAAGQPYREARDKVPATLSAMENSVFMIRELVRRYRHIVCDNGRRQYQPVSPIAAVKKALKICQPRLHPLARNVELFAAVGEELLVSGDSLLLEQAIINLLLNAASALPNPEAKIRIEISQSLPDNSVSICVADEGCGLPGNFAALFPAADHVSATSPRQEHGIGLRVVGNIARAHGGSFCIRSRCGDGTEAILLLPLLREPSHVC